MYERGELILLWLCRRSILEMAVVSNVFTISGIVMRSNRSFFDVWRIDFNYYSFNCIKYNVAIETHRNASITDDYSYKVPLYKDGITRKMYNNSLDSQLIAHAHISYFQRHLGTILDLIENWPGYLYTESSISIARIPWRLRPPSDRY